MSVSTVGSREALFLEYPCTWSWLSIAEKTLRTWFGVWCLGFWVCSLGFGVWGFGFDFWFLVFGVRVWSLVFRVEV